uniref:Uncharacterized protein n=1 Tax=Noccaea caerulescens TaxID=107243 RepID=A0A1J3GB43_NOCCA
MHCPRPRHSVACWQIAITTELDLNNVGGVGAGDVGASAWDVGVGAGHVCSSAGQRVASGASHFLGSVVCAIQLTAGINSAQGDEEQAVGDSSHDRASNQCAHPVVGVVHVVVGSNTPVDVGEPVRCLDVQDEADGDQA